MPHKSLKNILIEIVLFITMVALTGHLTANFWERYVVQKELSYMKNSLDHLKVKVHHIGNAYDDLQQELIDLARINSKTSIPQYDLYPCKKSRAIDESILQNLDILLMKVNKEAQPLETSDKDTGGADITNNAKNAATATRYPMKTSAVGSESTHTQSVCPMGTKCKYNYNAKSNIHKCRDNHNYSSIHDHKCLRF